jgi:hypothetical protein
MICWASSFSAPPLRSRTVCPGMWLVRTDGTGLQLFAALGADDPSITRSPDGRQLFNYGGSGSFFVDVASGESASYPFLAGYGAIAAPGATKRFATVMPAYTSTEAPRSTRGSCYMPDIGVGLPWALLTIRSRSG